MATEPVTRPTEREPELLGQTVVVIGGSAGIGSQPPTGARRGRRRDPDGRNQGRLERAAKETGARGFTAFDAADPERLARFFADLPTPIDHVIVTAGRPYYAPLADFDFDQARRDVDEHLWLSLHVARDAGKVRPGGTLLFMSGTGGRRPGVGLSLIGALTAAHPALVANLAVELAPVRVRLTRTGASSTARLATSAGVRRGERTDQRKPDAGTPPAGAAHEQQRAAGAYLAELSPARHVQRQPQVFVDVAPGLVEVEVGQGRVVRAARRDHHVVDRRGQVGEEPCEALGVGGVEGGEAPGARLLRGALQPPLVAAGQDPRRRPRRAPGGRLRARSRRCRRSRRPSGPAARALVRWGE